MKAKINTTIFPYPKMGVRIAAKCSLSLFIIFAATLNVNIVKAQTNPDQFISALTGGLEFGAATLREPLVSGFIGYNKPQSYFKFKFSSVLQETYEVNINGEQTTVPGFSELALMLGKRMKINSNSRIEFGVGAAVVSNLIKYDQSNSNTDRDKIIQKNAVGVVGEVKYIYRFVDGVGISLSINGNVNKEKTFASAGMGIVLTSKLLQ